MFGRSTMRHEQNFETVGKTQSAPRNGTARRQMPALKVQIDLQMRLTGSQAG
jgi:hypothetical protein